MSLTRRCSRLSIRPSTQKREVFERVQTGAAFTPNAVVHQGRKVLMLSQCTDVI